MRDRIDIFNLASSATAGLTDLGPRPGKKQRSAHDAIILVAQVLNWIAAEKEDKVLREEILSKLHKLAVEAKTKEVK